jgi:endonuclease YncB( thermonuclease family)
VAATATQQGNATHRAKGMYFARGWKRDMTIAMRRLTVLALAFAVPAFVQTTNDTAGTSAGPRVEVIDGDTVEIGSQRVHLAGIDAPEKWQTCDDGRWYAGALAQSALEDFIAGRRVTCKQLEYDTSNNWVAARCFAGGDDLQALMVAAGRAWSFGKYSDRYALEEREAAAHERGVHGHQSVPPSEWRARRW